MVKLPDKKSLEGFSKKISDAVRLPDEAEKKPDTTTAEAPKTGLSEKELEKIREEERKKIETERKEKEDAEKAKKYEEIEAQKRAEEARLLEEKKKQVEMDRLEKERLAEEAKKQKERDEWAREEEKKRLEDEKKRAEIEKDILKKQKEEQKTNGKKSHTLRNILIVIVIILAVIAAGYVSLITGNTNVSAYGYPLSYSTTYDVLVPDDTSLDFGGIPVSAISSGGSVTLKINNDRRTLSTGETATFPAQHIIIKTLGITVYDTDYQITATYLGVVTNRDDFRVTAQTSASIPSWLIRIMIPSGVELVAA
ncbi:hypothetical protein J2128_001740 [Methanomicrobium sp. W14]|uniref:hypothetical protein n=1 Tax=Methanomicrobium sp. W14 TaxID=2817839 RepID=UPI001AE25FD2|nr:hypothetical protein [Methanomicrobium sp. W14]MBP2133786.1 hypothetical protein [Methanomicrobium sp. W14]